MAVGRDYKTLRATAKDIQSNLQKYAPIRTGNLRSRLRSANSVNNILGKTKNTPIELKNYSFEFSVNYAPSGAEYGKWWNDPTVSKTVRKGKTNNIPESINFAEKALDDAIQKNLKQLLIAIGDDFVEKLDKIITDELGTL